MKIQSGTTISHYKILSEIGKGGMGEVYLAEDTELDRKVAIKFLSEEFSKDSEQLKRFVQEAKAASALNHPNIITIHQIGKTDDARFIALEYIEGETLTNFLKNPLKLDSVLEIATQIASALDAAHSAGIVHRDIKPDNVMIRKDGLVKILDFGIAKLLGGHSDTVTGRKGDAKPSTSDENDKTLIAASPHPRIPASPKTTPGMIIGTANYMSPEQAKGQEIDARTDIFSLGVVLYEMISGELPFQGATPIEIIGAILHKEPESLPHDVSPELRRIAEKALEKDREDRYQAASDLVNDLTETKKRLEFEAELERTSSPDSPGEPKTQILIANTADGPASKTTADSGNSIAVMPFEHLSADEDDEYFCDGLAEELINALAKVERLDVAARSSSFSFKGKKPSLSEVSRTLNVGKIIEGSVRKAGNRLRISVQLVNTEDGYQIWSERYDRKMKDIFDVQDEIALAVVEALKVKLLGSEREAVLKRYTSNTEAYRLYLQGRFFFSKRTPDGFDKAIEYYERAIEIDADYAIAYSGLADCYGILGYYELLPTEEAERLSVPLARRALEIDDTIAEVWVSIALNRFFDWDYAVGDAEYQKAIELDPKYAPAYHFRSTSLMLMGRNQEAIECSKRAIELEPFAVSFNGVLAWWYYLSGLNDEAIDHSLKTIELAPNHFVAYWVLGIAYANAGNFETAIANLQKAAELSGNTPHVIAELGRIYAESGRLVEAKELLQKLRQRSQDEYVSPVCFAKLYLGFGDKPRFLEEIGEASNQSSFRLPFLLIDPLLDSYRSEHQIQKALRLMNMPTDKNAKTTGDQPESKTIVLEPKTSDKHKKRNTISAIKSRITENRTKRDWQIAGILSLLIVVFGILGYYFTASNSRQIESIAVMPFENRGGDADTDYLSDGLADSLIYRLSQLPGLQVSPTSSVMRYKGEETNVGKIAGELKVDAVMSGRLVQRGDDLSISVQLIDARNEKLIWAEQYDRKMSDLMATQREIATTIAQKLRLKLAGSDTKGITKKYTDSNEAYQLYMRGRYYFAKRTKEDMLKSIDYFQQAIRLDANFALAHARIAEAYNQMPAYPYLPPKEAFPKAKEAAERALEIDPTLSEAHAALANTLAVYDWNWKGAEREFKQAIILDPNNASAHFRFGQIYLSPLRRHDEAIAEMKRGLEIEPLDLAFGAILSEGYFFAGEYDRALEQAKKITKIEPSFILGAIVLTESFLGKKMYADAISICERSIEEHPNSLSLLAFLGYGYARMGRHDKAEELLTRFRNIEKTQYIDRYHVALIYVGLGDKDKAFAELEKAFSDRSWFLHQISTNPLMNPLRGDPRYRYLLKRMGLPE